MRTEAIALEIIGLDMDDALELLNNTKWRLRLKGQAFSGTGYDPGRLNITIESNKIISVTLG